MFIYLIKKSKTIFIFVYSFIFLKNRSLLFDKFASRFDQNVGAQSHRQRLVHRPFV